MKTESVDLDDTNSNEDWIKEVTRKREASQRAGQVTPPAGKSLERMRAIIEKGGPGSGSWNGPGDPRFAKDLADRSIRSDGSPVSEAEKKAITSVYARHPSSVIKWVNKVIIFPDSKELKDYVQNHPNFRGYGEMSKSESIIGCYDKKGKTVLTASTKEYVLDHEMGHAALSSTGVGGERKWITGYVAGRVDNSRSIVKIDRFTTYSKENYNEGFAESYVAYVRTKGKTSNPRVKPTFDLIRSILS